MDKYEMQKKGHHKVYGDIDYPKGIWFDLVELESFEYTGFAIVVPDWSSVFDIYDTYEEAEKMFLENFAFKNRYAEIWQLDDSRKINVVLTNLSRTGDGSNDKK